MWCGGETNRIFVADYTGEGRADLLCHDNETGTRRLDSAAEGNVFTGSNWSHNSSWCAGTGHILFFADVDADGRSDLICHDTATGEIWVDYYSTSTGVSGSNVHEDKGWCLEGDGGMMSVGDFDGDGHTDLLCATMDTWDKEFDYGDNGYGGTDWTRNSGWCALQGREILVGDFNGDGRDDLMCRQAADGHMWIDYADSVGHFFGSDWQHSGFCTGNAEQHYIGDVNGDGRDDFVCFDILDGSVAIDYASTNGQLNGVEYTETLDFCNEPSSELH